MGYYSEVTLKLESKAYERIKEVCVSNGICPDRVFKDKYYYAHWDFIQWQPCQYESVKAITDLLQRLTDEYTPDSELGYCMARCGESVGDFEINSNAEISIEIKHNGKDLFYAVLPDKGKEIPFDGFDAELTALTEKIMEVNKSYFAVFSVTGSCVVKVDAASEAEALEKARNEITEVDFGELANIDSNFVRFTEE